MKKVIFLRSANAEPLPEEWIYAYFVSILGKGGKRKREQALQQANLGLTTFSPIYN